MKHVLFRSCSLAYLSCLKQSRRARRGLTLIELVLVVFILVILAALIIPRFGNVSRNAKFSASVSNLNDMTRTMDMYTTTGQGKIPDGFDSLMDVDDTSTIYPGNGDAQVNGGIWSGWLTVDAISAGEYQSLVRVASNTNGPPPFGVQVTVYDHDTTATNANLSTANATARTLAATNNVAFVDPSTSTGLALYKSLNLDPTDTTFRLLALGIGPHCTLIGRGKFGVSMAEAPLVDDPAPNAEFAYRRIIALFRVSGESQYFAEYMGAVTPYGKSADMVRSYLD